MKQTFLSETASVLIVTASFGKYERSRNDDFLVFSYPHRNITGEKRQMNGSDKESIKSCRAVPRRISYSAL